MIACISGNKVLPSIVYTPRDRGSRGVAGINEQMLIDYIEDLLGRSISGLDLYPLVLVYDKAPIHNSQRVLDSFHSVGCEELKEVVKLPTQGPKRLSPLDNSLFSQWKHRVRSHFPLTESNIVSVMVKEWEATDPKQIKSYYHHCGLTYGSDLYGDCPAPHKHNHPD